VDLAAAAIGLRLSATRSRWRRSRQLIEQGLGILQDRDVEAFMSILLASKASPYWPRPIASSHFRISLMP